MADVFILWNTAKTVSKSSKKWWLSAQRAWTVKTSAFVPPRWIPAFRGVLTTVMISLNSVNRSVCLLWGTNWTNIFYSNRLQALELWQFSLPILQFPPVSIIPSLHHTHFICHRCCIIAVIDIVKQHTDTFENGSNWLLKCCTLIAFCIKKKKSRPMKSPTNFWGDSNASTIFLGAW
jgi:hypothetical protein